ncbi:MAG: hypothetical protein HC786_26140 [Richelia sp. CSU_2_1]|nr:hypothetical protein [Richelia sp. CSU_2_1]
MPELHHENKLPDCLSMQLEGILVKSDRIDLPIAIEFNEQCELRSGEHIKFAVKGGTLKLEMESGQFPDNLLNLTDLKEPKKEQATENFHLPSICQITTRKASGLDPTWVFEFKMGSQVLKEALPKENLGSLTVNAPSCRVEATFEVVLQYLYITDVKGVSQKIISRNKEIVLARKIAEYLWKVKLQSYPMQILSEVALNFCT